MNKEQQDLAWSVLPKEFKEEVKELYRHENKVLVPIDGVTTLNDIFGKHNLTSDAEGEEMLTVSRKKVQEEYAIISEELSYHDAGTKDYKAWHYIKMVFEEFFGSKCLPDEEPKPAEPTTNYMRVDYHGADTAASTIADGCQSQPVTDCHDFDNIVNRGFRDHNRLHIAAQIVAALYAYHQAAKGFKSIEELVRKALDITDTLIKESEKGGEV